jgi:hypothetical protein
MGILGVLAYGVVYDRVMLTSSQCISWELLHAEGQAFSNRGKFGRLQSRRQGKNLNQSLE